MKRWGTSLYSWDVPKSILFLGTFGSMFVNGCPSLNTHDSGFCGWLRHPGQERQSQDLLAGFGRSIQLAWGELAGRIPASWRHSPFISLPYLTSSNIPHPQKKRTLACCIWKGGGGQKGSTSLISCKCALHQIPIFYVTNYGRIWKSIEITVRLPHIELMRYSQTDIKR